MACRCSKFNASCWLSFRNNSTPIVCLCPPTMTKCDHYANRTTSMFHELTWNELTLAVHRLILGVTSVVAQLVERRTQHSMTSLIRVRTPSGAQEKCVHFFQSKMLCCQCAQLPCVYKARIRIILTHVEDPVVHVRVRWITETRKDPACSLRTEG